MYRAYKFYCNQMSVGSIVPSETNNWKVNKIESNWKSAPV